MNLSTVTGAETIARKLGEQVISGSEWAGELLRNRLIREKQSGNNGIEKSACLPEAVLGFMATVPSP